jgi:hypothetical protein
VPRRHVTAICLIPDRNYPFSFKAPKDKYSKRLQSAFFQPKVGKGFFKSFSKTIGKDKEGRCFRGCTAVQTPTYLLLEYRLYWEDRKEMQRQIGSSLSLEKLFLHKERKKGAFSISK